ncbi:MAG TPA: hypothetical protein VLC53_15175 [Myxococcota bacterium]|nr:hypothetical protein [Myxococcota bacterium]
MRAGDLRRRALAAALAAFSLACGGEPDTPEAAVRRTLAAIEEAAGAKDVGAMVEHVSVDYADPQGNDQEAVRRIAAFHLLRNQSVHTLVRLREVTIAEPGRAEADALVAMAGTEIPDADVLATVRADLYRFAVTLREEEPGVWRVTSATWHPATRDDFR